MSENYAAHLAAVQEWLVRDQFEHGEWGKCEVSDPTSPPRTAEYSRLKPNVFTSCQAAYALVATGMGSSACIQRFLDWMNHLRDSEGYWVSAGGSSVPMGASRGWSEVRNLRHTAKGLDLLLLTEQFVPEDAYVFRSILESQLTVGAYPDIGGKPDIWATAYVMNLLLRALREANLSKTSPRGMTSTQWEAVLKGHLGRAREWLCGARERDGLWHITGHDPLWITRGVIAEIGGDIRSHHPELCRLVGDALLENAASRRDATCAWGLLLVWQALRPEQQKAALELTSEVVGSGSIPGATFSGACLCRIARLAPLPQALQYYLLQSSGHESALSSCREWLSDEYERWCIQHARSGLAHGLLPILKEAPQTDSGKLLLVGVFTGLASVALAAHSSSEPSTIRRRPEEPMLSGSTVC